MVENGEPSKIPKIDEGKNTDNNGRKPYIPKFKFNVRNPKQGKTTWNENLGAYHTPVTMNGREYNYYDKVDDNGQLTERMVHTPGVNGKKDTIKINGYTNGKPDKSEYLGEGTPYDHKPIKGSTEYWGRPWGRTQKPKETPQEPKETPQTYTPTPVENPKDIEPEALQSWVVRSIANMDPNLSNDQAIPVAQEFLKGHDKNLREAIKDAKNTDELSAMVSQYVKDNYGKPQEQEQGQPQGGENGLSETPNNNTPETGGNTGKNPKANNASGEVNNTPETANTGDSQADNTPIDNTQSGDENQNDDGIPNDVKAWWSEPSKDDADRAKRENIKWIARAILKKGGAKDIFEATQKAFELAKKEPTAAKAVGDNAKLTELRSLLTDDEWVRLDKATSNPSADRESLLQNPDRLFGLLEDYAVNPANFSFDNKDGSKGQLKDTDFEIKLQDALNSYESSLNEGVSVGKLPDDMLGGGNSATNTTGTGTGGGATQNTTGPTGTGATTVTGASTQTGGSQQSSQTAQQQSMYGQITPYKYTHGVFSPTMGKRVSAYASSALSLLPGITSMVTGTIDIHTKFAYNLLNALMSPRPISVVAGSLGAVYSAVGRTADLIKNVNSNFGIDNPNDPKSLNILGGTIRGARYIEEKRKLKEMAVGILEDADNIVSQATGGKSYEQLTVDDWHNVMPLLDKRFGDELDRLSDLERADRWSRKRGGAGTISSIEKAELDVLRGVMDMSKNRKSAVYKHFLQSLPEETRNELGNFLRTFGASYQIGQRYSEQSERDYEDFWERYDRLYSAEMAQLINKKRNKIPFTMEDEKKYALHRTLDNIRKFDKSRLDDNARAMREHVKESVDRNITLGYTGVKIGEMNASEVEQTLANLDNLVVPYTNDTYNEFYNNHRFDVNPSKLVKAYTDAIGSAISDLNKQRKNIGKVATEQQKADIRRQYEPLKNTVSKTSVSGESTASLQKVSTTDKQSGKTIVHNEDRCRFKIMKLGMDVESTDPSKFTVWSSTIPILGDDQFKTPTGFVQPYNSTESTTLIKRLKDDNSRLETLYKDLSEKGDSASIQKMLEIDEEMKFNSRWLEALSTARDNHMITTRQRNDYSLPMYQRAQVIKTKSGYSFGNGKFSLQSCKARLTFTQESIIQLNELKRNGLISRYDYDNLMRCANNYSYDLNLGRIGSIANSRLDRRHVLELGRKDEIRNGLLTKLNAAVYDDLDLVRTSNFKDVEEAFNAPNSQLRDHFKDYIDAAGPLIYGEDAYSAMRDTLMNSIDTEGYRFATQLAEDMAYGNRNPGEQNGGGQNQNNQTPPPNNQNNQNGGGQNQNNQNQNNQNQNNQNQNNQTPPPNNQNQNNGNPLVSPVLETSINPSETNQFIRKYFIRRLMKDGMDRYDAEDNTDTTFSDLTNNMDTQTYNELLKDWSDEMESLMPLEDWQKLLACAKGVKNADKITLNDFSDAYYMNNLIDLYRSYGNDPNVFQINDTALKDKFDEMLKKYDANVLPTFIKDDKRFFTNEETNQTYYLPEKHSTLNTPKSFGVFVNEQVNRVLKDRTTNVSVPNDFMTTFKNIIPGNENDPDYLNLAKSAYIIIQRLDSRGIVGENNSYSGLIDEFGGGGVGRQFLKKLIVNSFRKTNNKSTGAGVSKIEGKILHKLYNQYGDDLYNKQSKELMSFYVDLKCFRKCAEEFHKSNPNWDLSKEMGSIIDSSLGYNNSTPISSDYTDDKGFPDVTSMRTEGVGKVLSNGIVELSVYAQDKDQTYQLIKNVADRYDYEHGREPNAESSDKKTNVMKLVKLSKTKLMDAKSKIVATSGGVMSSLTDLSKDLADNDFDYRIQSLTKRVGSVRDSKSLINQIKEIVQLNEDIKSAHEKKGTFNNDAMEKYRKINEMMANALGDATMSRNLYLMTYYPHKELAEKGEDLNIVVKQDIRQKSNDLIASFKKDPEYQQIIENNVSDKESLNELREFYTGIGKKYSNILEQYKSDAEIKRRLGTPVTTKETEFINTLDKIISDAGKYKNDVERNIYIGYKVAGLKGAVEMTDDEKAKLSGIKNNEQSVISAKKSEAFLRKKAMGKAEDNVFRSAGDVPKDRVSESAIYMDQAINRSETMRQSTDLFYSGDSEHIMARQIAEMEESASRQVYANEFNSYIASDKKPFTEGGDIKKQSFSEVVDTFNNLREEYKQNHSAKDIAKMFNFINFIYRSRKHILASGVSKNVPSDTDCVELMKYMWIQYSQRLNMPDNERQQFLDSFDHYQPMSEDIVDGQIGKWGEKPL